MTEANVVEADTSSALQVEQHGFDYIDEKGRYLRPRQLFPFWWGSNVGFSWLVPFLVGGGIYWAATARLGPAGATALSSEIPVAVGPSEADLPPSQPVA